MPSLHSIAAGGILTVIGLGVAFALGGTDSSPVEAPATYSAATTDTTAAADRRVRVIPITAADASSDSAPWYARTRPAEPPQSSTTRLASPETKELVRIVEKSRKKTKRVRPEVANDRNREVAPRERDPYSAHAFVPEQRNFGFNLFR